MANNFDIDPRTGERMSQGISSSVSPSKDTPTTNSGDNNDKVSGTADDPTNRIQPDSGLSPITISQSGKKTSTKDRLVGVDSIANSDNTEILSRESSDREARTILADESLAALTPDKEKFDIKKDMNQYVAPFLNGILTDIYPILKQTSMDSQQLSRAMAEIKVCIELRLQ